MGEDERPLAALAQAGEGAERLRRLVGDAFRDLDIVTYSIRSQVYSDFQAEYLQISVI